MRNDFILLSLKTPLVHLYCRATNVLSDRLKYLEIYSAPLIKNTFLLLPVLGRGRAFNKEAEEGVFHLREPLHPIPLSSDLKGLFEPNLLFYRLQGPSQPIQ